VEECSFAENRIAMAVFLTKINSHELLYPGDP
jgi:hypothetical protein